MKFKERNEITFTTWGFPGGDVKNFCWHPNRSLDPEVLILGTTNQVRTNYNKET